MTANLRALQRAMRDALHERQPDALLARLDGRGSRTATDRAGLYVEMYWTRLVASLVEDFPTVVTMLGRELFERVAVTHVKRHPSRSPSLAFLGQDLPETLEHLGLVDEAAVGRLEEARNAAFWTPDRPPLDAASVGALGEALGEARFGFAPSLRVVTCSARARARVEGASHGDEASLSALPETVAVWRHGHEVVHAPLHPAEARALARACDGATVADSCEAFADEESPEEAAVNALSGWVARGWIVEIVRPSPGDGSGASPALERS